VSGTKESISYGVGLARKPRMAFLDSKQRLGDGGLYRPDRKGLQYVRSTEECTGLVLAWVGVLMQITAISVTQIKSFILHPHSTIKVLVLRPMGASAGSLRTCLLVLEYTLHRTLHASSATTCGVVDSSRGGPMPPRPAAPWSQSLAFATVRASAALNP
jgi:hypothetical protein